GHTHMDELVAMAVVAAMATGQYREAGVIAFFLIVANLIETRTALGARASIESLIRLTPTRAHRVAADGSEEEVDAKDLRPGQMIRVRPGDNIAADGEIVVGETIVNQANITGESMPVEKGVGDEVFSGTNNITGAIDIRVTKAGSDTTLGHVQQLIVQAESTKIPLMRLIDRYAGWYTPTILMLAAIVLFFTKEADRAISMLVVACPCALVLATPTAMVASLSAAARLGVLIKNVVNLEFARSLTAVVFDKTGTLTTGQLSVTRMMPAPDVDGAALLHAAASAEMLSKHPVARAMVAVAEQARLSLQRPAEFEEVAGRGVSAKLDGHEILVGRSTWLAERGADMSLLSNPEFQEAEGLSTLYVVRDGRCIGWIGLEDRTRPEARQALEELRELGVRVLTMVTGDRWSVARRVGREMGCTDVQAEVLPHEKLELVDRLKCAGHRVAVVGDGVNDAPALAAGDLGIAMGAAGSDVAINSASIALMNNDLQRLPFLVRLSRVTTRVIWQNLIFGMLYIVVLEVLAALGILPAMLAAMLHMLASAVVIFNSARLVRFGEHLGGLPAVVSGRAGAGRALSASGEAGLAPVPA
ncbi:MAG: cadmium-translocating P-type ATPase, partial [Phycisphaerae bacterium]|nr:cadmium-translocating P-type ATPase [Phycisphaerae bacterium]